MKKALTSQRIERSSQLQGLTRPPSALMGANDQAREFSVLEPAGNVLMSDRPTFRWSKLEGATGYVVEVYDEQFKLVTSSPELTSLSWTTHNPAAWASLFVAGESNQRRAGSHFAASARAAGKVSRARPGESK